MTAFSWIANSIEGELAERVVLALVTEATDRGVHVDARHEEGLLILRVEELSLTIVVSGARESKRPLVARAAEEARAVAERHPGGVPAVFTPHMTPAGIEAAQERGVGWFDLAGNGALRAPGVLLHVEGRKPANRRRGRPASAFSPRSARVARILLVEEGNAWTQKDLTALTELAQPTVSRALKRLTELGLVNRHETDHIYEVTSRSDLLDAWRDDYDYYRQEIVPIHLTGKGIALARKVSATLREHGVRNALTGLPAAWLYDHFAQYRLGSCYVDGSLLEAADLLGARTGDPEGANFHLVRPADRGVFYRCEEIEELTCVHPVQVYLDLSGMPERSEEAAEHLRRSWLNF